MLHHVHPQVLVAICSCTVLTSAAHAQVKSDERVVFFPTAARLSDDGRAWLVPIHGWIFEPEDADTTRPATWAILQRALDLEPGTRSTAVLRRNAAGFLVDNERGKRITVRIGPHQHALGPSGRDGHVRGTIRVPANAANDQANSGRLRFAVAMPRGDRRTFGGVVHLVPPEGVSVISDIDDTIKVSHVRDKMKLIEHTFVRKFRAVEGMPALYRRWSQAGAQFHFVSSSPWQLYVPLSEFAAAAGFPDATYHLKDFRLKDERFLQLFADPLQTKPAVIEPILTDYPHRKFILVGDSGEKDPEVYGLLARRHPEQVIRIFIRDVTGEPAGAPRYRAALKNVPKAKWQVFRDPRTIEFSPPLHREAEQ